MITESLPSHFPKPMTSSVKEVGTIWVNHIERCSAISVMKSRITSGISWCEMAASFYACRALFGDDRTDYGAALRQHYAEGPPPDWQKYYVSAYAASHPWEDFAETWAHYLHIVDTLEMASNFGMRVGPAADRSGLLSAHVDFDPYTVEDFKRVIDAWLPFVFAMNSVSRAVGGRDIYPFVLVPPVVEKLTYIHGLIQRFRP